MSQRETILAALDDIVAIPSCAQKAPALLEDPEIDLDELARVIEYDPGLTANLLKVVNASFFGDKRPMLTAREAIDRLGTTMVLQFVISTGVAPSFVQKIEGYDLEPNMHLQHSVTVALAARELNEVLELNAPDYTFTAALLSQIGKTLLGAYVKVDAQPILNLSINKGMTFDEAEDEILGTNHAEVGGIMLERWGLPHQITHVVRHHLRPDGYEGESVVLDLVHAANAIAKMIGVGLGVDGLNYALCPSVVERLKLTPEIVDTVSANVVEDLNEVWDLFVSCNDDYCTI